MADKKEIRPTQKQNLTWPRKMHIFVHILVSNFDSLKMTQNQTFLVRLNINQTET